MTSHRAVFIDGGLAYQAWASSRSNLRYFVERLVDLRERFEPGILGVAWDAPRDTTWRRKLSPAYKDKRPAPPGAFHEALTALQADLPYLDVLQYSAPAAEADDVLYTLSRTVPGPVLLVSGDKDLQQAIRPGADLLRPGHTYRHPDVLVTAENAEHPAGWWTSFLALAGDPVDGIPGLPGVGKKRAEEILEACPDFVGCLLSGREERIEFARCSCAGYSATLARWVERAIEYLPELRLSRELVALRLVEVQCVDPEPDGERARDLLWAARISCGEEVTL